MYMCVHPMLDLPLAGAFCRSTKQEARSTGRVRMVQRTLPFYLVRVRVGGTTLFTMSKAQKKKTTALREASMPQPRTAQPCRCRQFGWPLPRTHAHLFARRWLGACMHFCGRMHASPKSPWWPLQQQNGPKESFPSAGYRVISTCADAANPLARLINSLTTCVCPDPRFRRSA